MFSGILTEAKLHFELNSGLDADSEPSVASKSIDNMLLSWQNIFDLVNPGDLN